MGINDFSKEMKEALYYASKVDFLEGAEEITMFTQAIYEAIKWGKSVDGNK